MGSHRRTEKARLYGKSVQKGARVANRSEGESGPTLSGDTLQADAPSWRQEIRTPALRLSTRRVYSVSAYHGERVDSLLRSHGNGVVIRSGPYLFSVRAIKVQILTDRRNDDSIGFMLELKCSYKASSATDLEQISNTSETILDETAAELHGFMHYYGSHFLAQEFLDIELPRRIPSPVYQPLQRKILLKSSQNKKIDFSTAEFTANRLRFGPENHGAIDSVVRYLRSIARERPSVTATVLDSKRYSWTRIVPVIMGASLVLTWFAPLTMSWAVWFFVFFAALLLASLMPVLRGEVGLREVFRRARVTSTFFFFVIATFATCYAVADLWQPHALGDGAMTSLGYPYLIATGITFTVGLIAGTLTGAALIIAHIQMLVFMASLVAAILAILNIRAARAQDEY